MIFSRQLFVQGVFLILFLMVSAAGTAWAQQDSAAVRSLLEERDQQIKELLGAAGSEYSEEQREQLKNMINDVIDYEAMARYALQDTWDTLSAAQRKEFTGLFSSIVRDHSLTNLDIYRAKVQYERITVEGDSAVVRTIATLEDTRTPVSYDMYYTADGQWRVVDMAIDQVSTAEGYRKTFQRIINRDGYERLLETLKKRANRQ